jgi:hypothetical protein
MKDNNLARLLAYVTGLVNQELLLQNEYLAAENQILRAQCHLDCGLPIRSGLPWRRLVSGSAAKR